ncbi:agmatinase family protein [Methanobrevibacter curvatus]|uniref:Agmatinase n=1 Tax=Methanobrevibacter curvatus TaxID=49547 RepID=A0A165ZS08_9EURY|nr:agmatinase family protein [Methanobrevibacter curvatus]KZX11086.1 agmatinase [Methanobrevibacter curvatus]
MLFNTYEPWKFPFSQNENEIEEIKCIVEKESNAKNNIKDNEKNIWGIIGVGFDSTSSFGTGSRNGPISIRHAGYSFEKYNYRFKKSLETIFFDFGDLNVIFGNLKETLKNLEDSIDELNQLNVKPIVLGGEHSISLGVLNSLKKFNPNKFNNTSIIHFDGHLDMANDLQGEVYSHGTVLRRIHELKPKEIIQIGIRSSSYEEEKYVSNKSDIKVFSSNELKIDSKNSLNKLDDLNKLNGLNKLDELKNILMNINNPIYLTVDLDAFDPTIVEEVGNPVPNGIDLNVFEELLEIISKKEIVGFDLVELNTKTLGSPSAILAAKIIYDFLTLNE